MTTRTLLLTLLFAPLLSCGFFAPTITVEDVGPDKVYASLNHSVLDGLELSTATQEVLHAYGITDEVGEDPIGAVRWLHDVTVVETNRNNLFALAELSFYAGRVDGDMDAYLASAVYAAQFLFSPEAGELPSPFDRRFRWACDIYNSGVLRAFTPGGQDRFVPKNGRRQLPRGSLQITVDESSLEAFDDQKYAQYVAADHYAVTGLSLRLRDSGLGVPLVALTAGPPKRTGPATALLRLGGSLLQLEAGVPATLEFHSANEARVYTVEGIEVPVETDVSAALAYGLAQSQIWKFSLTGLFQGDQAVTSNRLIRMGHHSPGRIPVVFVHGTASNPAYWAEMFNTLLGDSVLRDRMEFWFFQYASGNPILFSAHSLRAELAAAVQQLDPEGTDQGLKDMVLVGHSQGGLVVQLMLVSGSDDWVEEQLGVKLSDLSLSEKQLTLIRQMVEFEPVEQVRRAVYISTPHRGSFMAAKWYTRMMAKFIAIPGEVQGLGARLRSDVPHLPPPFSERIPTSLDNMNPSSPMLKALGDLPISPRVTTHSIVAIGDADPTDRSEVLLANDGVVEYTSASIDGVVSEFLVNAPHSCQDRPAAIQEVRRILREHLAELDRRQEQADTP